MILKELVSEVEKTKNVVEATNMTNLYQRLEALLHSLTLCEKALAEYLETKRLVFPRYSAWFCRGNVHDFSRQHNLCALLIACYECVAIGCNSGEYQVVIVLSGDVQASCLRLQLLLLFVC